MPERIDRVTVAMSRRDVVLRWPSYDALLGELIRVERGRSVRDAVEGAESSSRAIELTGEQKAELLRVIEHWIGELENGVEGLRAYEGMPELLDGLIHDVRGAGNDT